MAPISARSARRVKASVVVKAKTGGDCVQNPSDLDATYSGHKGPGYQAQLAETCAPENEEQLITALSANGL